jgi:hypothetical protein
VIPAIRIEKLRHRSPGSRGHRKLGAQLATKFACSRRSRSPCRPATSSAIFASTLHDVPSQGYVRCTNPPIPCGRNKPMRTRHLRGSVRPLTIVRQPSFCLVYLLSTLADPKTSFPYKNLTFCRILTSWLATCSVCPTIFNLYCSQLRVALTSGNALQGCCLSNIHTLGA